MSDLITAKIIGLPELAILVTDHLKTSDLVTCTLVNRAWHKAIIPFLYHSGTIGEMHSATPPCKLCWDGFPKYSRYMRELQIACRARRDISCFGFHCTNLEVLNLGVLHFLDNPLWSWGLLKLISNNPGISTLRLTSVHFSQGHELDHHLEMLSLLRYMPKLKKLVIVGSSMGQGAVDEILRCSYRLEELDLTLSWIKERPMLWRAAQLLDFDLDAYIAELSLKDHDAVNTHVGPYLLDSQGRQYRQGTSLRKFKFILKCPYGKGVGLGDASLLARLSCSAEYIQLFITDEGTGNGVMKTLYDQISHPTWCLKHLDIGYGGYGNPPAVVKILRASTLPLVSFRLRDGSFSKNLLSILLQYHGKTLQRVSVDRCNDFFFKAKTNVEAVLSRCPNLQLLDAFDYRNKDDLPILMTGEPIARWIAADGRIFNMFTSGQVQHIHDIQDDSWWYRQYMQSGHFKIHIRFLAN